MPGPGPTLSQRHNDDADGAIVDAVLSRRPEPRPGPPAPKKGKRKAGRPRIELDLREVEALYAIGCTDEEVGGVLGVSVDTLTARKDEPDFSEAMARGKARVKVSIRRLAWKSARHGSDRMIEWLWRQLIGVESGSDGSFTHEIHNPGAPGQMDEAAAERFLAETRRG